MHSAVDGTAWNASYYLAPSKDACIPSLNNLQDAATGRCEQLGWYRVGLTSSGDDRIPCISDVVSRLARVADCIRITLVLIYVVSDAGVTPRWYFTEEGRCKFA